MPNTVNEPSQFTQDELKVLKKAGYPKPAHVSWGDWIGPRELNQRHHMMAMYAAAGRSNNDIAEALGFTASRVSIIMSTTRMKRAVSDYRRRDYEPSLQENIARMNGLIPKAIDSIQEILENPQEKARTKLAAANELLNRAIGKPKETVEIRNNSIREIFEFLDKSDHLRQTESLRLINNYSGKVTQASLPSIPTESRVIDPEVKTKVDTWITQVLPTESG